MKKYLFLFLILLTLPMVLGYSVFPRPIVNNSFFPDTFFIHNFTFTDNSGVLLSNQSNLTTDSSGVAYSDLNISSLTSVPTRFLHYRDGVLIVNKSFEDKIFRKVYATDGLFNNMNISENSYLNNVDVYGNVSFIGDTFEVNSTTTFNGNTTFTGSFETECLHCEDGDTYFHGDGYFEGNVTAPNIEVMESLIVHGNSTCSGTANPCGDALFIGNPGLCGWTVNTGQRGCRWRLFFGDCVGTATPCIDMSTATCEEQHTCTLTEGSAGFIISGDGLNGNISINITGNMTAEGFSGSGANLHSVNFTETDPDWNGNYSIFQGLINNESYLSTYNATYDSFTDTWASNYTKYYNKSQIDFNFSLFVPYTGATSNVNLGTNDLKTDKLTISSAGNADFSVYHEYGYPGFFGSYGDMFFGVSGDERTYINYYNGDYVDFGWASNKQIVTVYGNVTADYFKGDGSLLTGISTSNDSYWKAEDETETRNYFTSGNLKAKELNITGNSAVHNTTFCNDANTNCIKLAVGDSSLSFGWV